MTTKLLFEILIPTIRNDGRFFRKRYHKVWDKKVRQISGGLTIPTPAKGQWISKCGTIYEERVIPVRLVCTKEEMNMIADFSAKYYEQLAIMFYKVSDDVSIVHYDKNYKRKNFLS